MRGCLKSYSGFTLIELSIVLVIIGLIVGGVLVGRDLIGASTVRATITQVEKFNQATNTFVSKYGFLPGDMPDPPASTYGFQTPRAFSEGQGNGNGVISGNGFIDYEERGETAMFWVDLSAARLIDGGFTAAHELTGPGAISGTNLPNYYPAAKIGNGNYFYVYDGNLANGGTSPNNMNYYGLSVLTLTGSGQVPTSTPGLTVKQAYDIDKKIDDGLPQSGNVTALYLTFALNCCAGTWASGGGVSGAYTGASLNQPTTAATPGSPITCYDNNSVTGTQQYSIMQNNGAGMNCALTFKFQ